MAVFNLHVVGLAGLYGERLVLHPAPEESESAAAAALRLLDHLAVHLEDVSVVGGERVLHLAGERGLVLSADAHREAVAADALGEAPCAEGGEVELVVVVGLGGLAGQFAVVPELHLHALAAVEVLQVVHGLVLVVQLARLVVDDVRVGHSGANAFEQRVGVLLGGRAAVVAVEQCGVVGVGTYHGDGLQALGEGQHALVLKEHHRLAGGLCGEFVECLAADDVGAELGPGQHVGGVEHSQLEAAGERLAQVLVEQLLVDHSLLEGLGERHEHLAALEVGAVHHCVDGCREAVLVSLVLAAVEEVVDGVAVGEHDGVVAPLVAQDVDEQAVAGAAGLALEALVCAHHLTHVGLLHQGLEGGEVGLPEVAVGGLHVHRVAQRLRAAVHGVVLGAGVGPTCHSRI